jgi:uncharacterized protein YdhG (YjbR/CyaY superfamily)
MSSEGWKIDHNDHGTLEGSHQHDRGDPTIATLERADDGTRYFLCECGAQFVIDRDTHRERGCPHPPMTGVTKFTAAHGLDVRATAKEDPQMPSKTTTAARKASGGLTDEEQAVLKETIQERKAEARRKKNSAAGEADVLAKIAEMPESDRAMAKRIHAIVKASAPDLSPKTWYGMPAYANNDGKVVCFFQAAAKFKARYATFGFEEAANVDEGTMWATSWALTKLTADHEKRIATLVKKAVR